MNTRAKITEYETHGQSFQQTWVSLQVKWSWTSLPLINIPLNFFVFLFCSVRFRRCFTLFFSYRSLCWKYQFFSAYFVFIFCQRWFHIYFFSLSLSLSLSLGVWFRVVYQDRREWMQTADRVVWRRIHWVHKTTTQHANNRTITQQVYWTMQRLTQMLLVLLFCHNKSISQTCRWKFLNGSFNTPATRKCRICDW